MKTILFVSGGIEMLPGVVKAKDMGLRVVVSDRDPAAPGMLAADYAVVADTYNPTATLTAIKGFQKKYGNIAGVLCLGADVPLTAATVTNALGLPGISLGAARLASEKLAMKERFARDKVAIPWFSALRDQQHLQELFLTQKRRLVVKPVDSRGARGVTILSNIGQVTSAFKEAEYYSPTRRIMVEAFLDGPQISTESLAVGGELYTPGFADRNYEFLERFAPHIIENGGELPSSLASEDQEAVKKLVAEGAASLGITHGVVKGDIVVHRGKPYIIELAARMSGGYFCTHEIPLNTGVDFLKQAIKQAIGEPVSSADLIPRYQHHLSQRYLFPKEGLVTEVKGVDEVKKRSEIALCDVRIKAGDTVGPIHNHPARAGVIIATGRSRTAAMNNAVQAVENITISSRSVVVPD